MHRDDIKNPDVKEVVLVGHGVLDPSKTFILRENCFVITYCPDNYELTNSAIQKLSELRSKFPISDYGSLLRFRDAASAHLSNSNVVIFGPGDEIQYHALEQLPHRQGVGGSAHQLQFKQAMSTFEGLKITINDTRSFVQSVNAEVPSVSLGRAINAIKASPENKNGIVVIHWLACRRVMNQKSQGQTRCPALSVTSKKHRFYAKHPKKHDGARGRKRGLSDDERTQEDAVQSEQDDKLCSPTKKWHKE